SSAACAPWWSLRRNPPGTGGPPPPRARADREPRIGRAQSGGSPQPPARPQLPAEWSPARDVALGNRHARDRPRRSAADAGRARGLRAASARARGRRAMIRSTSIALVCALSASQAQPAFAYIKFGVPAGGRTVTLKWSQT